MVAVPGDAFYRACRNNYWIRVIKRFAETERVPPAIGVMVSAVEFPTGLRTVSGELITAVVTRDIPTS